jgi:hypothetical protein
VNLSELRARLRARGYDPLTDDECNDYINQACTELDFMEPWSYREASAVGAAPLAIADLAEVEAVTDESIHRPLTRRSFTELLRDYGDLSAIGTPVYWYLTNPGALPTIATYPVGSLIGVQYWRVPVPLAADGDLPAAPERFHGTIVDMAVRMVAAVRKDWTTVQQIQPAIDRNVDAMRRVLLRDQGPTQVPLIGDDC